MSRDGLGEGGFTRAVGPHDGVHFTTVDDEREAFNDFLCADGDVEIFDFQFGHDYKI
jgi:hypothetical protein